MRRHSGVAGRRVQQLLDMGECAGDIAARQPDAEDRGGRAVVAATRSGQILEKRLQISLAILRGQHPRRQFVGQAGRRCPGQARQRVDHPLRPAPIPHPHIDVAQRGHQRQIAAVQTQGIQQHAFGRAQPVLADQECCIPQRFVGRAGRGLNRPRQHLGHQVALACPFMGAGHEGQNPGVAGVLIQRAAQFDQRRVGRVVVDQPSRAHLQRGDMAGICLQHLFDQRPRARRVGVGLAHLGQGHLDPKGEIRRLGPGHQSLHLGNGIVPVAQFEPQACPGRAIQRPVRTVRRRFGQDALDLGQGRAGPAGLVEEADQHHARLGLAGGWLKLGAQEILGIPGPVARHIPTHQRAANAVVVREKIDHVAHLRLDRRRPVQTVQHPQSQHVKLASLGLRGDRGVEPGQRGWPVAAKQQVVDHHPVGDDLVRRDVQKRRGVLRNFARAGHVLIAPRLAIGQCQLDPADQRVGLTRRDQRAGDVDMAAGGRPIAQNQRQTRGLPLRLQIVGLRLGQAAILAIGAGGVAPILLQAGHQAARLYVIGLQLKDIAQLDDRARDIALFNQLDTALKMLVGALFGGLAGAQCQNANGHENGDGSLAHETPIRRWTRPYPLTPAPAAPPSQG